MYLCFYVSMFLCIYLIFFLRAAKLASSFAFLQLPVLRLVQVAFSRSGGVSKTEFTPRRETRRAVGTKVRFARWARVAFRVRRGFWLAGRLHLSVRVAPPRPSPRPGLRTARRQRKRRAEAETARRWDGAGPPGALGEGHSWKNQVTVESEGQRLDSGKEPGFSRQVHTRRAGDGSASPWASERGFGRSGARAPLPAFAQSARRQRGARPCRGGAARRPDPGASGSRS